MSLAALLAGCEGLDGVVTPPASDGGSGGSGGPPDPNGDSPDSVGDVVQGGGAPDAGQSGPVHAAVTARVRNEASIRADVTLRFIRDETVVHLAFLRVLPETVTVVGSPRMAEVIEASGVNAEGGELPARSLFFPDDFDADTPAEYVIPADTTGGPPDPSEPVAITVLEPTSDVTLSLGSTVLVRWSDTGGAADAVVQVSLRALEPTPADTLIPAGPPIGASLDGLNDELAVVIQEVTAGLYEVIAQISDATGSAVSAAPGRLRVVEDPTNEPPTLSIVAPATLTELREGDSLLIRWQDADSDHNATVRFSLAASETSAAGSFGISPPIAEDPDGPGGVDSLQVTLTDVLPGLYDLVGRIDDGLAVGTARRERVVRILAAVVNDPPQLLLIEPAADFEVSAGGSFRVRWSDSDANDNARITLMLDPDQTPTALDGDEFVLTTGIAEDDDGTGDERTVGVPVGVARGKYRVAGSITDGVTEVVTWAPGVVHLGVPLAVVDPSLLWRSPLDVVRTRLGQSVDIALESADVPASAVIQLILDNRAYGGTVRANVTPPNLPTNQLASLALPLPIGAIPNGAWPRRFDLRAELFANGKTFVATAPGRVLIRQEVEVLTVAMLNYVCDPRFVATGGERDFVGVQIAWQGGGFEERETHAEVAFWVTADGLIPGNDLEDSKHRVVLRALESPNAPHLTRLSPEDVSGRPTSLGQPGGIVLDPGVYRVGAVVEHPQFGRIVSPVHPEPIIICFGFGNVTDR